MSGGQWVDIEHLLLHQGPLAKSDFTPSKEAIDWLRDECRVLVIGAGGLGCELLKDLALVGFRHIDVIDMDTIDYSNLNRQFLFREKDVGQSKALVAAAFVNKRVYGVQIKPHHGRIEEFGDEFYCKFHIVVSGLDSVPARRWLNTKLVAQAIPEDADKQVDGEPLKYKEQTLITCINGGTEGWKGECRVMTPFKTPCFECLVDLFPKDPFNFPMCTMADKPRSPEHCIVFAMEQVWPDKKGPDLKLSGDNEEHILFIQEHAKVHATKFGLDAEAITYKLTQGVVKRIIPAIASTNACISAMCANEAFKILTGCYDALDNFTNFSGNEGCFSDPLSNQINDSCLVCGSSAVTTTFPVDKTLKEFIDYLVRDKGVFALFNRPNLSWNDEDDHDEPYIFSQNGMMMDDDALDIPMSSTVPDGLEILLTQTTKVDDGKGSFINETKSNPLKINYVSTEHWLKSHTEWIDEWGQK